RNLPNRTWKARCLNYDRLRNHVHKVIHLEQQVMKRTSIEATIAAGLPPPISSPPMGPHVTTENLARAQRMFWCIVANEWSKVSDFVVEQEQIISRSLA